MKRANSAFRLKEILSILARHEIVKGLTPEKLKLILEDLGPTFVKLGQILSLRSDMIPASYATELAKLRTDVNPMPMSEVREVIEDALGAPIDALFQKFVETPLGAASIAQAHEAYLMDGQRVVVKVQRPGIHEIMAQDIALLRRATGIMKLAGGTGDAIDFNMVLDEMWEVSQQEMNFLLEAQNAREFYAQNEGVAFATCPRVFSQYASSRVLVMEYIDGLSVTDKEALAVNGYDAREIARKLADNYIKQVVDDGFFHADPHPGNIKIRGGQIVWIDMGMMGRLPPREQALLKRAVSAVAEHDVEAIKGVIIALGKCTGKIDHNKLYKDVDQMLSQYGEADLGSIDIATLMNEVIAIARTQSISMPRGMTMLARGIGTLEGVVAELDPDINFISIVSSHVTGGMLNDIDWKKEAGSAARAVISSARKSLDIPSLASDALKSVVKGQSKFNIELSPSDELRRDAAAIVGKIILCALIAAFAIASGIMIASANPRAQAIGGAGFCISLACAVWLLLKIKKEGK